MRTTLLASAAVLGLALSLPAFAQTATDPNPANPSSIKDGTPAAGTGSGAAPGNDPAAAGKTGATLGAQAPQGGPGPLGEQANPAPAPSSGSSMSAPAAGTDTSSPSTMTPPTSSTGSSSDETSPATETPAKPRHRSMSSASGTGHWAHQPGTGESGPASAKASNIDSADTRSTIAPHLPNPGVGANAGPERYLQIADHALRAHKTGEAQQALEMAETRLLDRSTAPSSANTPDDSPRVTAVRSALKSLASKDWEGARKDIREAMNRPGDGGMASEGGSGGMATGATGSGTGTMSSGMSSGSTSTATGVGTTSTMAPSGSNQGVAGGNAGATTAPMDPSAQGPASPGAAGTPTPGASVTAPNQMQPSSGAK